MHAHPTLVWAHPAPSVPATVIGRTSLCSLNWKSNKEETEDVEAAEDVDEEHEGGPTIGTEGTREVEYCKEGKGQNCDTVSDEKSPSAAYHEHIQQLYVGRKFGVHVQFTEERQCTSDRRAFAVLEQAASDDPQVLHGHEESSDPVDGILFGIDRRRNFLL